MSKKQKRQVSSGSGSAAPMAEKIVTSRISTSTEFAPDYSAVRKDLKRIGIWLAALSHCWLFYRSSCANFYLPGAERIQMTTAKRRLLASLCREEYNKHE